MIHTQYPTAHQRLQRSELAVPGSNPEIFKKAAASDADYVILDLEDAVAPVDKASVRSIVIGAQQDIDWRQFGRTVSIRINGLDTRYMCRDMVDIVALTGNVVNTHRAIQGR